MKTIRAVSMLVLLSVALAACGPEDEGGRVTTRLSGGTSAFTAPPGVPSAVNVTVTGVEAIKAGATGWEILADEEQSVDLMAIQGDATVLMGDAVLPAGRYATLRLSVAEGATVIVDGAEHPLAVPSAAQTGVQFAGTFDVDDGGEYELVLEFDANQSVSYDPGSDSYTLAPAIRIQSFSGIGSNSNIP